MPNYREIDLTDFEAMIEGSGEFLRAWHSSESGACFFVQPENLEADPFIFGMAMVDMARHAARAWSQAVNVTEGDALARILEGFDAERAKPTTDIKQIYGDTN